MLFLIELIVRLALFLIVAGLLLGILCAAASTALHWTGAAFGFGFHFVRGFCENSAKLLTGLVADQFNSLLRIRAGQPSKEDMQARIVSLEHDLASALGRAAVLSRKVDDLRAELKRAGNAEDARLYAKVGLHPNSEDFLVRAARQAYRKHYHPDVCRSAPPEVATRVFQAAEKSFEEIAKLRRLD
jgi:hypothetical protein